MTDKKIKDFTKGIEEIAKLHPADRKKVFQMVADRNGAAAAGYIVNPSQNSIRAAFARTLPFVHTAITPPLLYPAKQRS